MDAATRTEIEAAAFRSLVAHLQARTDVQNIDLMNLAGFCRNCLGKWLHAAAVSRDADMSPEEARDAIYGMPYDDWKKLHQAPASPEQLARFAETAPQHAKHG